MTKTQYDDRLENLLAPGIQMMQQYHLEKFLKEERTLVCQTTYDACNEPDVSVYLGAAAHSFLIFRGLHDRVEEEPEFYTLLGDYFFSAFSNFLIPIDSTEVVLAFSGYLKDTIEKKCNTGELFDVEAYCRFLTELARKLKTVS